MIEDHRCPFPIGWWMNRGVQQTPNYNRSMMVDGIPNRPTPIFYQKDIIVKIGLVYPIPLPLKPMMLIPHTPLPGEATRGRHVD